MVTIDKKQQRQERIEQWQASGLTSAEWRRNHQINIDTFYYWKTRLLSPKLTRKTFVELPSSSQNLGINLECNGVRIHLMSDFDPKLLAQCIAVLRGLPCSK